MSDKGPDGPDGPESAVRPENPEKRSGGRRPRRAVRPGTAAKAVGEPDQTADDTDAGWGERPDDGAHERWLTEQRPPHWG